MLLNEKEISDHTLFLTILSLVLIGSGITFGTASYLLAPRDAQPAYLLGGYGDLALRADGDGDTSSTGSGNTSNVGGGGGGGGGGDAGAGNRGSSVGSSVGSGNGTNAPGNASSPSGGGNTPNNGGNTSSGGSPGGSNGDGDGDTGRDGGIRDSAGNGNGGNAPSSQQQQATRSQELRDSLSQAAKSAVSNLGGVTKVSETISRVTGAALGGLFGGPMGAVTGAMNSPVSPKTVSEAISRISQSAPTQTAPQQPRDVFSSSNPADQAYTGRTPETETSKPDQSSTDSDASRHAQDIGDAISARTGLQDVDPKTPGLQINNPPVSGVSTITQMPRPPAMAQYRIQPQGVSPFSNEIAKALEEVTGIRTTYKGLAFGLSVLEKYKGFGTNSELDYAANELARTMAGEVGNLDDALERAAAAKTMDNRLSLALGNPDAQKQFGATPSGEISLKNLLSAYDANGMRVPSVQNDGYRNAVPGTAAYDKALTDVATGFSTTINDQLPPAVRDATHYFNPNISNPKWGKDAVPFNPDESKQYHSFATPDNSTAQVRQARAAVQGMPSRVATQTSVPSTPARTQPSQPGSTLQELKDRADNLRQQAEGLTRVADQSVAAGESEESVSDLRTRAEALSKMADSLSGSTSPTPTTKPPSNQPPTQTTEPPAATPPTLGNLVPSFIKDAVTTVTKKTTEISEQVKVYNNLPGWAQNIVRSIMTGGPGTTPSQVEGGGDNEIIRKPVTNQTDREPAVDPADRLLVDDMASIIKTVTNLQIEYGEVYELETADSRGALVTGYIRTLQLNGYEYTLELVISEGVYAYLDVVVVTPDHLYVFHDDFADGVLDGYAVDGVLSDTVEIIDLAELRYRIELERVVRVLLEPELDRVIMD